MLKDPLSPKPNAYDVFAPALAGVGRHEDPSALEAKVFRLAFAEVSRLRGPAVASRLLAEVTRPDQRLALDLWDVLWLPPSPEPTGTRVPEPSPRRAVMARLMDLKPASPPEGS